MIDWNSLAGLSELLGLTPAAVLLLGAIYAGLVLATAIAQWRSGGAPSPDRDETELELRIRSWWIMVTLMALALIAGRTATLTFLAFVSYLALKEFFSIIPTRRADRGLLALVYLAVPAQFYLVAIDWYGLFIIFVPVYMFMLLSAAMTVLGQTKGFLAAAGTLHWGLISTVYSLGHIAYLLVLMPGAEHAVGAALVLALLVLTELNDVAQYVWGKTLGRHPVIPAVSPGKTWEGLIGGVLTTAVLAALLLPWLSAYSGLAAFAMGALIAVAGFFGDITVSAVKRDLGIKDSGHLIPGHGGVLDRVDSLIFTAPLFFHITRYFHT